MLIRIKNMFTWAEALFALQYNKSCNLLEGSLSNGYYNWLLNILNLYRRYHSSTSIQKWARFPSSTSDLIGTNLAISLTRNFFVPLL